MLTGNGGVSWLLGDDIDSLIQSSGGQYDLVSWDPRGTGKTKPRVKCFDSLLDARHFWNDSIRGKPLEIRNSFENKTTLSEFRSHVEEVDEVSVQFFKRCDLESMHMLEYVGTGATARDLVALHDYIEGNSTVNYWGFSYGTLLGSYFVNMFPDRVGRVILDGVLDPFVWSTKPPLDSLRIIMTDTETVFDGFAKHCAAAGPSRCAIAQNGSTGNSILKWTLNLLELAYDHTKTTGGTVTTSGVLRAQIWAGMYRPINWKSFAEYLFNTSQALRNSTTIDSRTSEGAFGSLLTTPFFPYPRRIDLRADSDDDQSSPDLDFSAQAIACSDAINNPNVTTRNVFDFIVNVTKTSSQLLGPVTWLLPDSYCHRWPARAVERYTGPFNKSLANPILVIGNFYDPVTPLVSAEIVANALGDSAVLMKRDAYGHTSLGMRSNCTEAVIAKYLNENKLPKDGFVCEADQTLF